MYGDIITMPMQEGLFRESGNNIGLACPFKSIICEAGYCHQCEIYLDWQKLGELVHVCAWCSKLIDRKPVGKPVVSHGICKECLAKYFPEITGTYEGKGGNTQEERSQRLKFRWNFQAFRDLPRYFRETWHEPWSEDDPNSGHITVLGVLRIWWIKEWHWSQTS